MLTKTQSKPNTRLQKLLKEEHQRPGTNWLALEIKKQKRRKEVRKLYEPKYGHMWKMFK